MGNECILLIDDDPIILKFVSANLKVRGYDVFPVEDGRSALAIMEQIAPNLVILDLLMPGMDGFEVCRRIRELSDVPIIILTASGGPNIKQTLLDLGASDYITKPFDLTDFMGRVQALSHPESNNIQLETTANP